MSKTKVKVLIACGSGVATSTVAQEAVSNIAKEAGIPIEIYKGTLSEVSTKQDLVDVVFTTANYRQPLSKPKLSVFGLISGINEEKTKEDVIELLKNALEEN